MSGKEEDGIVIYRQNPATETQPRYQKYELRSPEGANILAALVDVFENQDSGVAFSYSCRRGVCGMCVVKADGKTCLACTTPVRPGMKLEPVSKARVVRDLVVDEA